MTQENNKRIAKNTLMLYFRMGITMLVSLFTSRVVLNTLGVEDYGVYNVVGGVVTLFGFINSAMSSATSRYITFELGRKNSRQLHKVFCTSVNIHFAIAGIIFLLAETVGLWYMYNVMVIPIGRETAAMWVYQCSVIATMVMIVSVPYNACIIAHEKMSAFAFVSVLEVVLKLLIVYLLVVTPFDKLAFYAFLILAVQLLIRFIYTRYCKRHFKETEFEWMWDKKLTGEMTSFAVWSLWGNMSAVACTTGINLLLNFFFGPVVNAARAVSVQVQGAIRQFTANFQMALNPQITKSYAAGEREFLFSLMYRSARFSFFLLMVFAIPIQIEAETILKLWLKIVPDNTVVFMRIMLGTSLLLPLSNPLIILAQATGKIRKYQTIAGGVLLTILPISYVCLSLGFPAYSVFIVHFVVESIDFMARLFLLRGMVNLSVRKYFRHVVLVIVPVAAVSYIPLLVLHHYLMPCLVTTVAICALSLITSSSAIYFIGLTANERNFVRNKACYIRHKFIHK